MIVLVANAGSSSVKLRVVGEDDDVVAGTDLPAPHAAGDIERFLSDAPPVEAVGHRVVHGGDLRDSIVVDESNLDRLDALADLAPLHNRAALDLLRELRRLTPDLPQVACFDTAFHTTLPPASYLYALPGDLIERFGLRRYGFHGLSHRWAANRSAQLLGCLVADLRLVSCHLGAGASLAAVHGGVSVDTTMGFTPNEGLMMATRSGSVDPGLLLWLLRHAQLDAGELEAKLEHEAGLQGLAGTDDMRRVEAAAGEGDDRARTALDVYVHRLRAGVASMAAAMGGLDAVAFTGGVGENSAVVRREASAGLGFLGVELDHQRNEAAGAEDEILSTPGAAAVTLLIHSREELEIAASVRGLLG